MISHAALHELSQRRYIEERNVPVEPDTGFGTLLPSADELRQYIRIWPLGTKTHLVGPALGDTVDWRDHLANVLGGGALESTAG